MHCKCPDKFCIDSKCINWCTALFKIYSLFLEYFKILLAVIIKKKHLHTSIEFVIQIIEYNQISYWKKKSTD